MKRMVITAAFVALGAVSAFAKNDALSLIPADAVTVGVVRLSDIRTSPLTLTLFQHTDTMSSNGEADKFLVDAGLDVKKDVDVLVVTTAPVTALGSEAKVLVAADGRFNVERLTAALVKRGAVRKSSANGAYFILPDSKEHDRSHGEGAVAFPDGHLALVGSEAAVVEALADRAAGGTSFAATSGLGREMSRIDAKATAWALVDVARARRLGAKSAQNRNENFNAALKNVSTLAVWATDSGDSLKLGAFGLSRDAETLQLVEDTVRGALSMLRLAAQEKSPDLVSVLRKFNISRNDDSVTVNGTVSAESLKSFATSASKQLK
jgi:hypothetical protein